MSTLNSALVVSVLRIASHTRGSVPGSSGSPGCAGRTGVALNETWEGSCLLSAGACGARSEDGSAVRDL